MRAIQFVTEKWSGKYKKSINCSHPKGFSQKAHCAGRKKSNESVEEAVCPDCGLCQSHGVGAVQLQEACWPGYRKDGMKTMFGKRYPNCVKKKKKSESVEQGVAEGVNDYLWHGSKSEHKILYPQQAKDTGGKEESNKNAVYATPSAKTAIAMGLTTPGSDTGMFPNDPQMVLFSGNIRKGQMVYLHKVPKDLFIKHNSREWYSNPGVEAVKPIEVVKVPVDKYLNLIRQATPQDLELRKKYITQGVAEGKRIARKPGQPAGSKKHSDLYTDENPRGTITGLKFATADDARASVSKIKNSGRSHAHKIQAAVAMEQRARAAGKAEAAAVYRRYINATKKTEGLEDQVETIAEDLRKWFKQKWVRFGPDGKIRGDCARGSSKEGKPKCLPQAKAHALGKKGRATAASRKRREDPNANRSGKAINVRTK